MGELDALEDDLAAEATTGGSVPAYLQVGVERVEGAAAAAAVHGRCSGQLCRAAAASCVALRDCQAPVHAQQRAPQGGAPAWNADACSAAAAAALSVVPHCRTWTSQQCRRASSRRRRRSQQTSLACPPSRSERDGARLNRCGAAASARPVYAIAPLPCTLHYLLAQLYLPPALHPSSSSSSSPSDLPLALGICSTNKRLFAAGSWASNQQLPMRTLRLPQAHRPMPSSGPAQSVSQGRSALADPRTAGAC